MRNLDNRSAASGSFSGGGTDGVDLGLALVVGRSRINLVVVSKIAERAGLRCETCTPEEVAGKLAALSPGMLVLDGGPADEDCRDLYPELAARRRSSPKHLPATVLLSTAPSDPQAFGAGGAIDAVVAKPITPDNLQPLLHKLIEMARR